MEVRKWLYHRSNEEWSDTNLSDSDIDCIMGKENSMNLLLRRTPGTNGVEDYWEIKHGNLITLGELFRYGAKKVSCHDLYRTYLAMPLLITKRVHSKSNTAEATNRRNAKTLRHVEWGTWGLPSK